MKAKYLAWALIALMGVSSAYAKGGGRAGGFSGGRSLSSGFSKGFTTAKPVGASGTSSSRGASTAAPAERKTNFGTFVTRPAAAPATPAANVAAPADRKTTFGTFFSKPSATTAASAVAAGSIAGGAHSALSDGLSKNAAQSNALATLDARNAAKAANDGAKSASGARPVEQGSFGRSAPASVADEHQRATGYSQSPQPQTIIVHHNDSSSNSLLWYMLGRSTGGSHTTYVDHGGSSVGGGAVSSEVPAASTAPASNDGSSFLGSFLRIFVVLLVLSAIGWGVWFLFFKSKAADAPLRRKYTL